MMRTEVWLWFEAKSCLGFGEAYKYETNTLFNFPLLGAEILRKQNNMRKQPKLYASLLKVIK